MFTCKIMKNICRKFKANESIKLNRKWQVLEWRKGRGNVRICTIFYFIAYVHGRIITYIIFAKGTFRFRLAKI